MHPEPTDNPFVGLRPFESEETLLFFGRQQQTIDLLNRLHQYNFVGVTGSSGSGKSSLVRAGLIPKLKAGYLVNDRDKWIVVILKPGTSPMCNLVEELLAKLPMNAAVRSASELEVQIKKEGIKYLVELLQPAIDEHSNLFILVDQFEEIFRFSLSEGDVEKKEEAILFVQLLLQLSRKKELPIYITLTMRSDFVGDCSQIFGLPEALNQSQYLVPRLSRQQLKIAIEGPVRLYGGKIEAGLTATLLNDVNTVNDELPLLQHALMRMWEFEQNGSNSELTIAGYEAIGGIASALSKHADQAYDVLDANEKETAKKMFQALTGIDEKGRKIRRPAKFSDLVKITRSSPETLLAIIDRFIEGNRNFVNKSSSKDSDEIFIDISHESLIRQWGVLNKWVEQEAEAAAIYARLGESASLKLQKRKDLLTGNELFEINTWFGNFNPTAEWADRYDKHFVENVDYLQTSACEDRKQRRRRRRNMMLIYASAVVVFLILSAFAFYINKTNNQNKRQLALNYWTSSQTTRTEQHWLGTLHLLAEAIYISNDVEISKEMLIDAQSFLLATRLQNITDVGTIINDLNFSSDGRLVAAAGNNGTVQVIDKETGKNNISTIRQQLSINTVVFNRDNTLLLTAGNNKSATLYKIVTGKQVASFSHDNIVNSATFNASETRVLTACTNGYAYEWEIASGKQLAAYQHPYALNGANYNSSGNLIVTAGNDFTASLWNTKTRKEVATLQHNEQVTTTIFSPNDSLILTTSWDSTARLWNVNTHLQTALLKHGAAVTSAAFHPSGRWVATGSNDKMVRLWDVSTGKQFGAEMLHKNKVHAVAFSKDGKWLATSGRDEQVRIWQFIQPNSNRLQPTSPMRHKGIINECVYSPDGTQLLTAGRDSAARLWNAANGALLFVLPHRDVVHTAQFSMDGSMIVTASADSLARIWNPSNGKLIDSFRTKSATYCAAIQPNKKLLITADDSRTITLWDIEKRTVIASSTFAVGIRKAIFSPDGQTILCTGRDSSAYVFDVSLKRQPFQLKHEALISSAVFNADATKIVTTGYDMTTRIWDAKTLQQYGANLQHKADVNSAVFNKPGNRLLTGGWDFAVHQWSLLTFKELGLPKYHTGAVTGVAYSPAGDHFVSAGYDSVLRIWSNSGDMDLPPELFRLQVRALTGAAYNFSRGETQCMPAGEWITIEETYRKQAKAHAAQCKFKAFNQWLLFSEK